MNSAKDEALCRDFPLLYANRNKPATVTCMCWGFECEDGWEPLIRDLSAKLERLIAAQSEPRAVAAQVKQKFGTLRFYMTGATADMYMLIEVAERHSNYVCESCGAPGKVRDGYWVKVLCDTCNKP